MPKLLGTYELELHGTVAEILFTRPSCVIDIGAAEGYYAVGLAAGLGEDSQIVAFEMDSEARRELTRLAESNGVAAQINCLGECTVEQLDDYLENDCLVICDCEGAEVALLDPVALPRIRNAAILVELHDRVVDDIGEVFRRRFANSHSITLFSSRKRSRDDCATLRKLRQRDVDSALGEKRRFGLQWMWMKPFDSRLWRTGEPAPVAVHCR